jgi:hypothetical protein
MQSMRIGKGLLLFGLVLVVLSSCRKDDLLESPTATIEFSTDTLTFDTVFTTIGSTTKYLKVYNPHKKAINISAIRLAGTSGGQFRLNIDGVSTDAAINVEVRPEDSLYIFVEVTVDPNATTTPFVIEDQITFVTNGNTQSVQLQAWGQNANFFNGASLCDTTWTDDKPYVIVNYVRVDSGCTLTIDMGVNVHLYGGAIILVEGTLIVKGQADSVVTFQGARLEPFYRDVPGQWGGIFYVRDSKNNSIDYAHIKNAGYGVSVGSFLEGQVISGANAPDLTMTNTVIENAAAAGIFGFLGIITAENVLVYNCGLFNFQAELGGIYDMTHCTFANFSSQNTSHEYPVVRFSDFFDDGFNVNLGSLDATFTNCIVYGEGSIENEINIEVRGDTTNYDYLFENCLLKTTYLLDPDHYKAIVIGDPYFVDREAKDYTLKAISPCNDKGKVGAGSLTVDLAGIPRGAVPDLGCFEITL